MTTNGEGGLGALLNQDDPENDATAAVSTAVARSAEHKEGEYRDREDLQGIYCNGSGLAYESHQEERKR